MEKKLGLPKKTKLFCKKKNFWIYKKRSQSQQGGNSVEFIKSVRVRKCNENFKTNAGNRLKKNGNTI